MENETQLQELQVKLQEMEAQLSSLVDEKTRLLNKNNELLGKVAKFKKFETLGEDADVEELMRLRERAQTDELVPKAEIQNKYQQELDRERQKLQQRQAELEKKFAELEAAREQERQAAISRRIDADVLAVFGQNGDVISPKQLLMLTRSAFTYDSDLDQVVVKGDLKTQTVAEFLGEVRENPEYGHFFRGKGVSGSGLMGGETSATSSSEVNPFKKGPGYNLTAQALLYKNDRAKAERLKREAEAS